MGRLAALIVSIAMRAAGRLACIAVGLLLASVGPARGQVDDALARAEELLRRGQPGAAAELIERSGLAETDPQAGYLLGFAWIQVYRFADAERALEAAIARRPDSDAWLHALAKARLEQGKNLGALEALDRAVAISDDPRYRFARAMCALNIGDQEMALRELKATVAAVPAHAEALYYLGKLAVDGGDYRGALTRLRQALGVNPGHLEARYLTGLAELRSGRPEVAVQELQRVVEVVPAHAGALYNLGRALIAAGRPDEGRRRLEEFRATSALRDEIDFLRRAVKRNPANLEGRLALGASFLRAGQSTEALRELRAARDLAPGRAETYRWIAEALRRLGQEEDAARAEAFARRLEGGG